VGTGPVEAGVLADGVLAAVVLAGGADAPCAQANVPSTALRPTPSARFLSCAMLMLLRAPWISYGVSFLPTPKAYGFLASLRRKPEAVWQQHPQVWLLLVSAQAPLTGDSVL